MKSKTTQERTRKTIKNENKKNDNKNARVKKM